MKHDRIHRGNVNFTNTLVRLALNFGPQLGIPWIGAYAGCLHKLAQNSTVVVAVSLNTTAKTLVQINCMVI